MLRVNQLARRYGSFVAVENVSFSIGRGEIVGLLGHNGAGKTTIMKMVSGYLEPNDGQVEVDGIDLAEDPKRVQQQLGYLPENLPVYPEMSVADYLDYAADLKGLKGQEKTDEIRRAIKATDIQSKLLAPIETLSRGFKQRVGVAQAILGKPKLLILDEPTNGLDPEQTQHMRDLIREIAKDATVILSTHIMQEVNALCSRVLMLRSGQLALDEKLADIQKSRSIELVTSIGLSQQNIIDAVDGVEAVTLKDQTEAGNCFSVAIKAGANIDRVSADIAKAVVTADHHLFELKPAHKDLEQLFKEVNEHQVTSVSSEGESRHAA